MLNKCQIKILFLVIKIVKGKELRVEYGQFRIFLIQIYVEQKIVVKVFLLDQYVVISVSIFTGFKNLCKVVCVGIYEVWVNGTDQVLICVDIFGVVQGIVRIICIFYFNDISMIRKGELVYINFYNRTVNIVRYGKLQMFVIIFEGWYFQGICDIVSGDFLVSMVMLGFFSYKVVCYDGQIVEVKREIDIDDSGDNIFIGGKY